MYHPQRSLEPRSAACSLPGYQIILSGTPSSYLILKIIYISVICGPPFILFLSCSGVVVHIFIHLGVKRAFLNNYVGLVERMSWTCCR